MNWRSYEKNGYGHNLDMLTYRYCTKARVGLHYGPWSRTMEEGLFQWSKFMVRLLEKYVLKALGPSLGVNQVWTKKNDHASESECVDFF